MLYRVYGFNFQCDHYINKFCDCIEDHVDQNLPIVNISSGHHTDVKMTESIELSNEFCSSKHSADKSYFRFSDGKSILVTSDEIQFGGREIDDKLIGGPDIIVLSRLHNRAVLHGSAFLYRGKAYLLCAYPGAGKSTLSAAISKYQNDTLVLTDDIICISSDGTSMYNGLPRVSLNNDSFSHLYSEINNCLTVLSPNLPKNSKIALDVNTYGVVKTDPKIKIGGVFFLNEPLETELVKIEKFNGIDFFCQALKNIKLRQSLVGKLLIQEMQILDKMTDSNIFGVKLRIKHEYSALKEITNRIVDYIEQQTK